VKEITVLEHQDTAALRNDIDTPPHVPGEERGCTTYKRFLSIFALGIVEI
jgi:hypothetical protein